VFIVKIEPYNRDRELLKLQLSTNTGLETILTINSFNCFNQYILDPNPISLDILYFTSIIYAIDKLIPRVEANDNWSRDITVSIPVSNKELWKTAIEPLKLALDFLTSDNWILLFEDIQEPYYTNRDRRLLPDVYFYTVCLFSGGLDSLAGVIDTIDEKDNILLVSHIDGSGASMPIQKPLIRKIKNAYPDKNIEQSVFRVYTNNNNKETTTRGRSILFHGLALFHSINLEVKEVIASENGVISINLPLTPSRTCSNSTKTMHPYFLKMFQDALTILNIDVQINNPYLLKTKGEMLLENRNPQLVRELATKTLSCSHGGGHTKGWNRQSYNCGYCIPCTIRRASIHAFDTLLDKDFDYGHGLNGLEINLREKEKRLDLLALSYFLKRKLNHRELKREINLMAKLDNVTEIAYMLERGYTEIEEYIMAKGDSSIKRLFS